MSPLTTCVLALLIFTSSCLGHKLPRDDLQTAATAHIDGYAAPQPSGSANALAGPHRNRDTTFSVGNIPDNTPKNVPYWWFSPTSPFKHTYRRVASVQIGSGSAQTGSGTGSTRVTPPLNHAKLDLSHNPFLNGEHKHQGSSGGLGSGAGSGSGSHAQSGSFASGSFGTQGQGNQGFGSQGNTHGNTGFGSQGTNHGNTGFGSQGTNHGNTGFGSQGSTHGNTGFGSQGTSGAFGSQGNNQGNTGFGSQGSHGSGSFGSQQGSHVPQNTGSHNQGHQQLNLSNNPFLNKPGSQQTSGSFGSQTSTHGSGSFGSQGQSGSHGTGSSQGNTGFGTGSFGTQSGSFGSQQGTPGSQGSGSYNHGSNQGSGSFGSQGTSGPTHGNTGFGSQGTTQGNTGFGTPGTSHGNTGFGSQGTSGAFGSHGNNQANTGFGSQGNTQGNTGFGSQGSTGNTGFGSQGTSGAFGSHGTNHGNTGFGSQGTSGSFGSQSGQNSGSFGSQGSSGFGSQGNTDFGFPAGKTVSCSAQGHLCVSKHLCVNGLVSSTSGEGLLQVRNTEQNCNSDTQVCCKLPEAAGSTPGSGSGTGTGSGSTSGSTTQCDSFVATCVPKHLCLNGFLNVNGENIFQVRSQIQHCSSSDVCCRYPQHILDQSQQTTQSDQPSTGSQTSHQTSQGVVQPSQTLKPGSVIQNGHYIEFGSPEYAKLPQQLLQSLTYTGFSSGFYGGQNPVAPDLSSGKNAVVLGQTGVKGQSFAQSSSFSHSAAASFSQSGSASYSTSGAGYRGPNALSIRSSSKDQSGAGSSAAGQIASRGADSGSQISSSGSQFGSGSHSAPRDSATNALGDSQSYQYKPPSSDYLPAASNVAQAKKPFQADAYIPPREEKITSGSRISPSNILPPKSDDEVATGGSRVSPTALRPEAAPAPSPHGCAAALKCVDISFCTFEGVMSKSAVTLTPRQNEYRVPLTDCSIPESGALGKCCRDPDYVDPWPASQLGQYNPDAGGFDNGQYKGERYQSKHRPQTSGSQQSPTAIRPQQPQTTFSGSSSQVQYDKVPQPQPDQNQQPHTPSPSNQRPQTSFPQQPQNTFQQQPQKPQNFPQQPQKPQTFPQQPQQTSFPQQNFQQQPQKPQNFPQQPQKPQNFPQQPQQTPFPQQSQTFPQQPQRPQTSRPQTSKPQNEVSYTGSPNTLTSYDVPEYSQQATGRSNCGNRNPSGSPSGPGPIDGSFGEFPWQAMVLLQTNKSLLCGGAIVEADAVVTAAHCVDGLNARDILIKGGEWKLGVDDEPETFQIVQVKSVSFHPAYQPTDLQYDVAILHLAERLRFDKHIDTICLPEPETAQSQPKNCVATGWGKETLQGNEC